MRTVITGAGENVGTAGPPDEDVDTTPTPAPTPTSVLLWRPDELPDLDPAELTSVCCLRSTTRGARAAVYRTTTDQGIIGVVDFLLDAAPRPGGGWCAPGVLRRVHPCLPRGALLDDEHLGPVFAHLQGRRGLPLVAGHRLAALLPALPPSDISTSSARQSEGDTRSPTGRVSSSGTHRSTSPG